MPFDPKSNALEGTGLRIWVGRLVFPLFWNEVTKMSNFYKILTFSDFNIDYDVIFGLKYAKPGSFKSMWHRECDESYRESIAQLHRTRWAKNRIPGPKIENRLSSENRESIFRSKLMPISVMIEPNEPKKIGRFPGTENFPFFVA